MGSLISCIALVPWSLSRISHKSQILNTMKEKEITSAENAIRFEVVFDTNKENTKITSSGVTHMAALIPVLPC